MAPPTRIKLRTEDRQAELVQAALQLAAQRSPAEVTTADLAQAVGITQGGVFKHFESKEAVWLAVIGWTHQTLGERLTQAAQSSPGDPLQALRAMFMAHIDFVCQYPGVPRLIFQELQHTRPTPLKDRVQLLMSEYRQLLLRLLGQAQQAGLLAPRTDRKAAAVLFIGAVQGLVMQSLMMGHMQGIKPQAATVFKLYEAALRARPEPVAISQRQRKSP